MSWSMSASGTAAAVERTLLGQKVYGTPSEEEQRAFDNARSQLIAWAKSLPMSAPNYVNIVKAAASGHGPCVSNVSFGYEIHALE